MTARPDQSMSEEGGGGHVGGAAGRILSMNSRQPGPHREEARLFSSIWHRDRLIIRSDSIEGANDRLSEIMSFVPQYRKLVVCGQIPKRARYSYNARPIDSEGEDFAALKAAFERAFVEEEEETSVPPLQVI